MQILIVLLAAGVAAADLVASATRVGRSDPVLVRSVVDGDTIHVVGVGAVRLLGIDAPEISHGLDTPEPFGREARERLASLVLNRWVRLEMEGTRLDAYNRHLAYVMTEDGQFVNATLVRDGLARVSAREPLGRLDELRRAEAEAQAARRGMWGGTPLIPPTREARGAPLVRSRKSNAAASAQRQSGAAPRVLERLGRNDAPAGKTRRPSLSGVPEAGTTPSARRPRRPHRVSIEAPSPRAPNAAGPRPRAAKATAGTGKKADHLTHPTGVDWPAPGRASCGIFIEYDRLGEKPSVDWV